MKISVSVESLDGEYPSAEQIAQALRNYAVALSQPTAAASAAEPEARKRGRPPKAAAAPEPAEPAAPAEADDGLGLGGEPEPAKAATLEDVISALQGYMAKNGRDKTAKLLAEYGVKSVRDLKPEQYAKVVTTAK